MKRNGLVLAVALVAVLLFAVSSWATPLDVTGGNPGTHTGFAWAWDGEYFTNTDHTTAVDGNSNFTLVAEQAQYESDFGIFYVDDQNQVQQFQVFEAADEPGSSEYPTLKTLTFHENTDGTVEVSLDQAVWIPFSSTFGFYYGVYNKNETRVAGGEPAYYEFFSDSAFNTEEPNIQHVAVEVDSLNDMLYVHLDDQLSTYGYNRDNDYTDMTVFVTDIEPAEPNDVPVPEPGTLALFGLGLVGLAFYRRRKM